MAFLVIWIAQLIAVGLIVLAEWHLIDPHTAERLIPIVLRASFTVVRLQLQYLHPV